MAYDAHTLKVLLPFWQRAKTNLFLGYPDFILPLGKVVEMTGVEMRPGVSTKDRIKSVNPDGSPKELQKAFVTPHPDDMLDYLGVRGRTYVDHLAHHDCEVRVDLNEPTDLERTFDGVHETGTIEHVANPWEAIKFMVKHTRVGGVLSFLQMIGKKKNHGFYELQPNFFFDLVSANPGLLNLACLYAIYKEYRNGKLTETEFPCLDGIFPEWLYRQHDTGAVAVEYVFVFQKLSETPLVFPIQQRYTRKVQALTARDYAYNYEDGST